MGIGKGYEMSTDELPRKKEDRNFSEDGNESRTTTVFVHTQTAKGKSDWINQGRKFLRLPIAGEYIALSSRSPWYCVEIVIHCPFNADYAAEIYATEVDHMDALKKALR